jgi:SAM-dependent methyltransferase
MIRAFMLSQALHVAAKLGIFDALSDGPTTLEQIAQACGADEGGLYRLLRFLTAVDVLCEHEGRRFSCAALGTLLRSDHPQSLGPLAVMYGESFLWKSWGDLYETVKTGKPAFERVHGETFFSYLAGHEEEEEIFNAAMATISGNQLPAILTAYDFAGFKKIVDVGGGNGKLLRGILEQYPSASGVLCDLPSVLAGASEFRQCAAATRCELVDADIFRSVPSGGDAYILKLVLHDWSDTEAVQVLQNCRRAMTHGGKVLVMEAVVKPSNEPDLAKWLDLSMLASFTGRERTAEEFSGLYAMADLHVTRVIPAQYLSIIEGIAA